MYQRSPLRGLFLVRTDPAAGCGVGKVLHPRHCERGRKVHHGLHEARHITDTRGVESLHKELMWVISLIRTTLIKSILSVSSHYDRCWNTSCTETNVLCRYFPRSNEDEIPVAFSQTCIVSTWWQHDIETLVYWCSSCGTPSHSSWRAQLLFYCLYCVFFSSFFYIQMSNGFLKSSPDDIVPLFLPSFPVFCVIGLIRCHSLC